MRLRNSKIDCNCMKGYGDVEYRLMRVSAKLGDF